MTRIEASAIIPGAPDEVFRYASDWRKWAEWFDGASDVRPTAEIARGNGARYAYTVRVLGFRATVETEITEFVEGCGWKGIAGSFWTWRSSRSSGAASLRRPFAI